MPKLRWAMVTIEPFLLVLHRFKVHLHITAAFAFLFDLHRPFLKCKHQVLENLNI